MVQLIPVYQNQFLARRGPGAGNCHQACIASIFELPLDQVPNLMELEDEDEELGRSNEWFRNLGFTAICFPAQADVDAALGWHIGIGPNARNGVMHSCVYYGTNLRHDPHPEGGGLAEVQHRLIFVPLNPTNRCQAEHGDKASDG